MAVKSLGYCRIRPNRQGNLPVGFKKDHVYRILDFVYPKTSQNLSLLVVNESGGIKTLLASDVTIVPVDDPSVVNDIGACFVIPSTPGFRANHRYRVITHVYPNGTSDLHLLLVNESGTLVHMLATDVRILTPDSGAGDFVVSR